jgi:predicted glycosyltransferase
MRRSGNIVFYNHLDSPGMMDAVSSGETIITRAGYTTIMELISMKCSAILIPTPGQTEQEYLGRYLAGKGWFRSVLQKEIAGELLSNQLNDCPAEEMISQSRILLDNAMNELSGNYQH